MQKQTTTTKQGSGLREMMSRPSFKLSMVKGMVNFMEKTGQLKTKTSDEEIEREFKEYQAKQ